MLMNVDAVVCASVKDDSIPSYGMSASPSCYS